MALIRDVWLITTTRGGVDDAGSDSKVMEFEKGGTQMYCIKNIVAALIVSMTMSLLVLPNTASADSGDRWSSTMIPPQIYQERDPNRQGLIMQAWTPTFPETESVVRIQIRFITGGVEGGGQNDNLYVSLNSKNGTWIDYGRDDFERNDDYTYDLLLEGVSRIDDIEYISLSKTGNDGWCVKYMALVVNGRTIFDERFSNSSTSCRWLDNDHGQVRRYAVARSTLRAHPLWAQYRAPDIADLAVLTRAELESLVEATVGHEIHFNKAKWGDKKGRGYVEISSRDSGAVHVDLDLEADIFGPNPSVDVDFDLRFACHLEDGDGGRIPKITIAMQNLEVDTDSPWWYELMSTALFPAVARGVNSTLAEPISAMVAGRLLHERLDDAVASKILKDFPRLSKEIEASDGPCPVIIVGQDGTVTFWPRA